MTSAFIKYCLFIIQITAYRNMFRKNKKKENYP